MTAKGVPSNEIHCVVHGDDYVDMRTVCFSTQQHGEYGRTDLCDQEWNGQPATKDEVLMWWL